MAKLPPSFTVDPTLAAVDAAMEAAQESGVRPYLGMSCIGHACERKLWFDFRWAKDRSLKASSIKAVEDGFQGEPLQAARFRMVKGIELVTHQDTGQQIGFRDLGGHLSGHIDGIIRGLLQAPKAWHIWEHKQVNPDKFKKLNTLKNKLGEDNALAAWDEIYYAQAVMYMHYADLDRHYLTCSSPGGRDTISVRTKANSELALRLIDKARRTINAVTPPLGISDNADYFQCKWCDYHSVCFDQDDHPRPVNVNINCRTCLHSTPIQDGVDGEWTCNHWKASIPEHGQRIGCERHLLIPSLVYYADVIDADETKNLVVYQSKLAENVFFVNGNEAKDDIPGFTSLELARLEPLMHGEPMLLTLKSECGATVDEEYDDDIPW